MNRRTFGQIAFLSLAKPLESVACSEPFATVSNLEGLPVAIGNGPLKSYLKRELRLASFEVDHQERIRVSVPRYLEGGILPFSIEIVGGPFFELTVFIERYVEYKGRRWAHLLEPRYTRSLQGRVKRKMLRVRYRGVALAAVDTSVSGISSRFKQTLRTDARLIVTAALPEKNGKAPICVAQSPLIEESLMHCGGTYFVDSYDGAVAQVRNERAVSLASF